jgi:threonine dehydrogenase-like Zn-dependent dehydrogenase
VRAAFGYGDHDGRIDDLPDPALRESTDAIVQVVLARVCSNDLWEYRSGQTLEPIPTGYAAMDEHRPIKLVVRV